MILPSKLAYSTIRILAQMAAAEVPFLKSGLSRSRYDPRLKAEDLPVTLANSL
jgi:hypothetical protein